MKIPIDNCHVIDLIELMIRSFADRHTKELYETGKSKKLLPELLKRALRKLDYIENAEMISDLKTHPGEMLREDFLPDFGISVSSLAKAIGVSRQTVNELLRGKNDR